MNGFAPNLKMTTWLVGLILVCLSVHGCRQNGDEFRSFTEEDLVYQNTKEGEGLDYVLEESVDPQKTAPVTDTVTTPVTDTVTSPDHLSGEVINPSPTEVVETDESIESVPSMPDEASAKENSQAEDALPEMASDQQTENISDDKAGKTPEIEADMVASTANGTSITSPESSVAEMGTPLLNPDGSPVAAPTGPLEIKLLVPERILPREGPDQVVRISFDDIDLLKVLNMEPVPPDAADHFPAWLKELNGQRVILRGWMFPPTRQEGISSFMFVRDNGICCFGRNPKVYDKLGVQMRDGVTTNYIQNRPFDVIGTLLIEPEIEGDDEGLWWLYFIEDAVVIDK